MSASQDEVDLARSVADGIRVGSIALAAYEYVTGQLPLNHSSTSHKRQLPSHPSCRVAVLEVPASAKPNKVGPLTSPLHKGFSANPSRGSSVAFCLFILLRPVPELSPPLNPQIYQVVFY